MSLLHRYALRHNCFRNLIDLDKLNAMVADCDIVDDILVDACPKDNDENNGNNDNKDKSLAARRKKLRDKHGRRSQGRLHEPTGRFQNNDGDCDTHHDEMGNQEVKTSDVAVAPTGGTDDFRIRLDYDSNAEAETNSATFPLATDCSRSHSRASNGPACRIRRSQMDRLISVNAILRRATDALLNNIHLIEEDERRNSTLIVNHFLSEAERLQGSGRVQFPRIQRRAMAAAPPELVWTTSWEDFWGLEPPEEIGKSGAQFSKAQRWSTSSLVTECFADDVVWQDEVRCWQRSVGQIRNEEGRRWHKI